MKTDMIFPSARRAGYLARWRNDPVFVARLTPVPEMRYRRKMSRAMLASLCAFAPAAGADGLLLLLRPARR